MTLRKNKNGRYPLFDTVRGLCIAGMVLYHALFDCVYMFGLFDISAEMMQPVLYIRDFGCMLFVLLAGMCEHFGKQKYKRAVMLLLLGAVISLISCLFMPQQPVMFGVLTFLGFASILLQPLKKFILRYNYFITRMLLLAIFLLLFNAAYGTFGVFGLHFGTLPDVLYANTLTAILGFPPADFASSDYFPIIPWMFLYLFGFCLYPVLQKSKMFEKISAINIQPFSFIGRYSLWFYLAHQPVIMTMLFAISEFIK
ncbi:MAG: DUF1624 domain-containing protein [Ruminococcaceae bacterium]|nr:DUF1624 domain-containing protein [Oscillospiraceae bacterium]